MSSLDLTDLSQRTARGVGWVVFWRFSTRTLGMASTLILAHLLAPSDFGLVALAANFALAIEAVATTGVHDTLVREGGGNRSLYNTAFTFTLLRGAATGVVIAAIAIPAGSFFNDPRLAPILFAFAGFVFLEGVENIGILDFRKYFRFDQEFLLFLIPRCTGILTTITAAVLLHSYWAIVIGIAVQRIVRFGLGYWLHPHRPRVTLVDWRKIFSFSVWLWAVNLAGFLRERSDTMIVGRMLDSYSLGLFMLSTEIATLTTTELVLPLCRVLFSSFSAVRNHDGDPRSAYLMAIGAASLFVFPASVGLSLVAPVLVPLLLGNSWVGAVALVSVLAPLTAFGAIGTISSTAVIILGFPKAIFWASSAMAVVRISLLIAGIYTFGIIGAAWATAMCMPLDCILLTGIALRLLEIRLAELIGKLWRSIAATLCMVVAVVGLGLTTGQAGGGAQVLLAQVAVIVAVGAAVYGGTHVAFWVLCGRPVGGESFVLGQLLRASGRWRTSNNRRSDPVSGRPMTVPLVDGTPER